MRKKAFTLIEIITVVTIIGILATIGYPAYENAVEDSKAKVSQTNLKALKAALDIYVMEYDQVPGDLSQIPPGYIKNAYAAVIKREGAWKIKLAYFIAGLQDGNLAYALNQDFLLNKLAKGDRGAITDPSDLTPPGSCTECVSYGLNSVLNPSLGVGITAAGYEALTDATIIIAECDTATFTSDSEIARRRHKRRQYGTVWVVVSYGQGISRRSEIKEITDTPDIPDTLHD